MRGAPHTKLRVIRAAPSLENVGGTPRGTPMGVVAAVTIRHALRSTLGRATQPIHGTRLFAPLRITDAAS